MATRSMYFMWIALICLGNCLALGTASFDNILEDVDACNADCDKTYPLHTHPKESIAEACKRGCRFFSIGDFINDQGDLNVTKNACDSSCQEAYNGTEERPACLHGCSTQFPFAQQRRKQEGGEEPSLHVLSPLMYIQKMYGNVMDHMTNFVSVSWSYYVQQDDGKLVVVQSGPRVMTNYVQTEDHNPTDVKPIDSKSKSSGIHYVPLSSSGYLYRRQQGDDALQLDDILGVHDDTTADVETDDDEGYKRDDLLTMDWLGCVSRKSGLPRWFLGMTIFLSSFAMMWLCFATTATAPEHKINSQKVNYLTDLDYLRYYDPHEKVKIQPCPDDVAGPLPVKVHLDKL